MASSADARARGAAIEALANDWLIARGLTLGGAQSACQGRRTRPGDARGETLVFVEVRHRRDSRHGHPLETVTISKQRRLIKAARFYLARNGLSCPCRFDVVAVTGSAPDLEFLWVKAAFEAF